MQDAPSHPVSFSVDYPERELDWLTTLFRPLLALPILLLLGTGELHVMIRDEKHRYTHQGGKPHETTHQQMVTRSQAFGDAMAILTPDQRLQAIESLSGSEK